MILSLIIFIIGLAIVVKAADWVVEGASSVALRFKIAPIVIGLTVVAFGTSTPELVVSLTSAISGNTAIALGNIVGSNIANILLILGISALVAPLVVHKNTVWKEIPMSFLGAVIMAILGIQHILDEHSFNMIYFNSKDIIGSLTFSNGLVLLSFFIIFLYYTFGIAKVTGESPAVKKESLAKSGLFLLVGFAGLIFGSKVMVDNAVFVARSLGMSDTFIGLTLVAVGTSVPELVTSVVAAYKKKVELAVGNIVGSNIFNIFFILGLTSLVRTVPLSGENLTDILVLFGSTLFLFVALFLHKKRCITRAEGAIMVALYAGYIVFLFLRG